MPSSWMVFACHQLVIFFRKQYKLDELVIFICFSFIIYIPVIVMQLILFIAPILGKLLVFNLLFCDYCLVFV
jgi:hypothetical protein